MNAFLLLDRIVKIKSMDRDYNLRDNAYISFSGGKDSTVLSRLVDLALPGNRIPRVFINTGIEYKDIVEFVKSEREKDDRIEIVAPSRNISDMLEDVGYPFKSKEHSMYLSIYQNSGRTKTVVAYLDKNAFGCPKVLHYQFEEGAPFKVSSKCCTELKKKPAALWAKEHGKSIIMTGMRRAEGGLRSALKGCAVFKDGRLRKLHPLAVASGEWVDWFIAEQKVELCRLYYPPFSFERTGCKGCPFNIKVQKELDTLSRLLPNEYRQCEMIWKKVYDEYRRIGYRLKERSCPRNV